MSAAENLYVPFQVIPTFGVEEIWRDVDENLQVVRTYPNVLVTVEGDEWLACHEQSFNRGSNAKTGGYGFGIGNTKGDPRRVERVGLLGEMALAKIWNLPVDFTYRPYDNYDFVIDGKTVDIKTTIGYKQVNFIQAMNEQGRMLPLKHDIYVFASIWSENSKNQTATVVLKGWQTKDFVNQQPIVPARDETKSHKNWEVEGLDLNPLVEINGDTFRWVKF